jgi:hypothetical protein
VSTEETTGISTWRDPDWRAGALEWAAAELADRGLAIDGEPEQAHVHAWSMALRLPVDSGAVWLKSVGPGSEDGVPGWTGESLEPGTRREVRLPAVPAFLRRAM